MACIGGANSDAMCLRIASEIGNDVLDQWRWKTTYNTFLLSPR